MEEDNQSTCTPKVLFGAVTLDNRSLLDISAKTKDRQRLKSKIVAQPFVQDSSTQNYDPITNELQKESTGKIQFLWKAEYSRGKEVVVDKTPEEAKMAINLFSSEKHGFRTSPVLLSFWKAVGMTPVKEGTPLRGREFPILVTNVVIALKKMEFRVLSDVEANTKQPLAFRQVTIDGRSTWTENEAHTHLVNEATLASHTVMRNTNNLHNQIRKWGDAYWIEQMDRESKRGEPIRDPKPLQNIAFRSNMWNFLFLVNLFRLSI